MPVCWDFSALIVLLCVTADEVMSDTYIYLGFM